MTRGVSGDKAGAHTRVESRESQARRTAGPQALAAVRLVGGQAEGAEVVVGGGGGRLGESSKHRLCAECAATQQTRRRTLAQRSPSEFGSVSASCSLAGSLSLASATSWNCVVSEE